MGEVTPIALSRPRLLDSLQPFSPKMIKREQDIMQTTYSQTLEILGLEKKEAQGERTF